jgi:hypothetical protein
MFALPKARSGQGQVQLACRVTLRASVLGLTHDSRGDGRVTPPASANSAGVRPLPALSVAAWSDSPASTLRLFFGILNFFKVMPIQALVTKPFNEVLDMPVLHRLARLDMAHLHSVSPTPVLKWKTHKFRPVVDSDLDRFSFYSLVSY